MRRIVLLPVVALILLGSQPVPRITTVAGNGTRSFCGDGGPAVDACLQLPSGVIADSHGNVFIADYYDGRVRKVDATGTITTVAGNGTPGFCGDGGQATATCLTPDGVAIDAAGNLFIATGTTGNRVRKVDLTGTITTYAGSGAYGFCGDGGPATSACLTGPEAVAVDTSGNLYIADLLNYRIRKVDTAGKITTVAGNGVAGYCGDGGPATSACLAGPNGIAVDADGNLFIADWVNQRIRKVDATGIITTVAGNGGTAKYCGDGGAAVSACLGDPLGVAVDGVGSLFIAERLNNRIRKVDADGIITTYAGNGTHGFCGDAGPATEACLQEPWNVGVDDSGNVLVADTYNHRVRRVSMDQVLTVDISATPGTYSAPGQTISYTVVLANAGAEEVEGPFSVTDTTAAVVCPATPSLAPGASIVCAGNHAVTQADMDAGHITSIARAIAPSVKSLPASDTVTLLQTPTLTLAKTLISGCVKTYATVTLAAPAPIDGTLVTVSADNPHVQVKSFTMSRGATSKSLQVRTTAVAAVENVTITASVGSDTSADSLTLKPMGIKSLALSPSTVVGGHPVTGTVALECEAGPADIVVALSSTNPEVAALAAPSVTVSKGVQSVSFGVTTTSVAVVTKAKIKATANGTTKTKPLTVSPGS